MIKTNVVFLNLISRLMSRYEITNVVETDRGLSQFYANENQLHGHMVRQLDSKNLRASIVLSS